MQRNILVFWNEINSKNPCTAGKVPDNSHKFIIAKKIGKRKRVSTGHDTQEKKAGQGKIKEAEVPGKLFTAGNRAVHIIAVTE